MFFHARLSPAFYVLPFYSMIPNPNLKALTLRFQNIGILAFQDMQSKGKLSIIQSYLVFLLNIALGVSIARVLRRHRVRDLVS